MNGAATFKTESDGQLISSASSAISMGSFQLPVIEEHADHVRVLCEGEQARVALFVARGDLHRVAKERAVLRPAVLTGDAVSSQLAAGLYLRPGVILPAKTKDGDQLAVKLQEPGVHVWGKLPASAVGDVFEDIGWELPSGTEAHVKKTVLLAEPDGSSFAEIGTDQDARKLYTVQRLARTDGKFTLIRRETSFGELVGWVPTKDLVAPPSSRPGDGGGIGVGYSSHLHQIPVVLPRGTLLRAHGRQTAIGVVTRDLETFCSAGCFGARPAIAIDACGRELWLEAMTPARTEPTPKE